MDDIRPNRRLCMGWALVFFWPIACTPLLVIPYLLRSLDSLTLVMLAGLLVILMVLVMCDFTIRLVTRHPTDEPLIRALRAAQTLKTRHIVAPIVALA